MIFIIIATCIVVFLNLLPRFIVEREASIDMGALSAAICIASMMTLMYVSILWTDLVFSDEYKNRTMKNLLTAGLSRATIYFGKLIASAISMAITSSYLWLLWFITGMLLFGPNAVLPYAGLTFVRALALIPLLVGSLALGNLLAFHIPNSNIWAIVHLAVLILPHFLILGLVVSFGDTFDVLFRGLLLTPLITVFQNVALNLASLENFININWSNVNYVPNASDLLSLKDIAYCLAVGIGWTAGCSTFGWLLFKHKEIK